MKRYPAFDPPEYLTWEADPALVTAYRERCAADPERQAIVDALAPNDLVSLYRDLLRTRLHDIGLGSFRSHGSGRAKRPLPWDPSGPWIRAGTSFLR